MAVRRVWVYNSSMDAWHVRVYGSSMDVWHVRVYGSTTAILWHALSLLASCYRILRPTDHHFTKVVKYYKKYHKLKKFKIKNIDCQRAEEPTQRKTKKI